MSAQNVIAVSVRRWLYANEEQKIKRHWYVVELRGCRGGAYEVDLIQSDGKCPTPYAARTGVNHARSLGMTHRELVAELFAAAKAAIL